MARIKIKELPVIRYDEIQDTHITIVETKEDTYQASIADMKKVYSCDAKLSAIVDAINEKLQELEDLINSNNETIYGALQELKDALGVIENNVKNLTTRLKTAEDKLENHESRIGDLETSNSQILERLDENDQINQDQNQKINSLINDNETNKQNIEDLRDKIQEHDEHLSEIDQTLEDHKQLIDSNKEETDNIINENFEYLNDRLQRKYMELLSIIDFYHHLTHDNEGNVILDDGNTTIIIKVNE